MRVITVEDHLPEYGTIVVRDVPDEEPAPLPLLGESDLEVRTIGTIARAGDGWLMASARGVRHHVRLEAHDGPPPLDEAWHDVVETSYHARSGFVELTTLMAADPQAELRLGAPGCYRVRVSCRRTPPETPGFDASAGDLWRMQFWPGSPEPPRWVARSRPPVPPPDPGWSAVLGIPGQEVLYAVQLAAATGERVAACYRPWSSRSGGWDSVLREDLSELGVPAPATRPELLRFLVAAGVVIAETSGGVTRYRLSEQPPRAEDVLRLPDERRAVIRRQDARHRYTSFVADLAAVAVWSRDHTVSATPAELSGRMLATEEEIRETIAHGIEHGLLSPSGEGAFTAAPRRPPESGHVRTQAGRPTGLS